jgi:drug/metabolite transporter (DMT)-like permease
MIYVIMFFQSLLASGTHIVAKAVVTDVDPTTLTLLRSGLAGLILYGISAVRGTPLKVDREDRPTFLLLSFLGIPLNQFLFLTGLHLSKPTNAALFYGATPALVLVFSVLLGKEKRSILRLIGVLVAFSGILVVVFEHGLEIGAGTLLGDLLLLGAVVAWTFYTVLGKDMVNKYGPIHATSVTMVWGMAMFLPFGLVSALQFDYSSLNVTDVGGIVYLAVGTSIITYFLWYYALGKMAPSKVAIFANTQPVFTMLLAWFFLGEILTPWFLLGAGITLGGVILTEIG